MYYISFQVSLPQADIKFNNDIAMDLMWLQDGDKKRATLHVVDLQTGYSNAVFLNGQTVEDVWTAFLHCWVTTYLGYPSTLRVDQGRQFTAQRWSVRAAAAGIVLKPSGVESHNSLGLGERYHAPLRKIYERVRATVTSIDAETALRLAVKTMNDTMGPDGLVPTLLVYGSLPRLPTSEEDAADQKTRTRALEVARREYEGIVAQRRIATALRSRIPAAATRDQAGRQCARVQGRRRQDARAIRCGLSR